MSEVWIGFTEVSKAEGCELDFTGAGAFVWWATQAGSEDGFLRKLEGALEYYKLVLLEVERIREFGEPEDASEDVYEIVEQARENEDWILFGTFYSYPHHDA